MKTKLFTLLTMLLFVGFMLPGLAHAQALVMDDQDGCVCQTITFTVSVNSAPNDVEAFGFEVGYDPTVLDYNGPTGVLDPADPHIGDLLQGWTMVGINESVPGTLTIGCLTVANSITAGDSGSLIMLDFHVLAETATDLTFGALVDDMDGWTTDDGQYTGECGFCPNCDNPELEECVTGLDVQDTFGPPGGTANMVIDVNNALNEVSSFGFEVCYSSDKLTYTGPTGVLDPSDPHIGDLLTGWTMVGINVLRPGKLRIGGFTTLNAIAAGATGSLIKLKFGVSEEAQPLECYCSSIYPDSLVDDIEGWPVCWGLICTGCPHDGDVDENESITPQDALYAFGFYLGMLPPCDDGVGVPEEDCLTLCQQDHADVCSPLDPGSDITPVDALCIFTAYMYGLAPQDPLPCGVCD